MKKQILSYNDLVRKYYRYIRRRQNLILANRNQRRQAILAKHIERLHAKLTSLKLTIQKGSLAVGVVAGAIAFSPNNANAQNFAAPVTNPFSLPNSGGLGSPTFYDLDNDGDLDILYETDGTNNYYHENTGSNTAPVFGAIQTDPFGIDNTFGSWRDVKLVDLDNDGDADLIMNVDGDWQYQQNIGTASVPSFDAAQTNPFGLTYSYYYAVSEFADIDDDGDLDMIAGNLYGDFIYFQNDGTASVPSFSAYQTNPFGLSQLSSGDYNAPTLADIDGDGDFDLLAGDASGDFFYFENTGTASAPAYAAEVKNPFNLINVGSYYNTPTFVDLDNDGDMDIMTKAYDIATGDFMYFENITSPASISETSDFTYLEMYPNPSNGIVSIDFNEVNEAVQVEILSMDGKLVYTQDSFNENHVTIDVSKWSSGIYTVKLNSKSKSQTLQLVVE